MVQLTMAQEQILRFCWDFYLDNDQLPTTVAIAKCFQHSSANAAFEQLSHIARKGYLERDVLNKWKFTAKGREMMAGGLLEYGETVRRSYPGGPLEADMRLTRV